MYGEDVVVYTLVPKIAPPRSDFRRERIYIGMDS